jgi:ligand-binding sensor domain-containing protein
MTLLHRQTAFFLLIIGLLLCTRCQTGGEGADPYREDLWSLYNMAGGLSSNQIMSIKADSRGNLWVGTWNRGLMKFDGSTWTFLDQGDGLPDFTVYAIDEDQNGDMLFGTFMGLSIYDGTRFANDLFGQEYLPIMDIHVDASGTMWLATAGFGLLEMISRRIKTQHVIMSKPQTIIVWSIAEDDKNVIWAGTEGGVMSISNTRIDLIDRSDGLPRDTVLAVEADSWGDVWMGVWAAEHVIRNGSNGMEEINLYNAYPDVGVHFIFEDSRGNVWFALNRAGVVKYDGAVMRTFRDVDGLPSNSIRCIEEDLEGNIWFGSEEHGLARLKPGNRPSGM